MNRETARRRARKHAEQSWTAVTGVYLDRVGSWDRDSCSVWEARDNDTVLGYVEVSHATGKAVIV